ncbi:MAG: hypothetical protein EYC62_06045 [Alphaproteobacteria bacterium]|nr:MAG: hypothetical protein EYC62_06045 [Alphaproteobacteria bacterium]
MITKLAISPVGRFISIAASVLLPHLPCVLIASGIWGAGAALASIVMNPWIVGTMVFASLWTGTLAHRAICGWRCAIDACVPAPDFAATLRHKSFNQLSDDLTTLNKLKTRRNIGLGVAYAVTAAASAVYLPPLLHDHSSHCASITSLDPDKRILLACPNSEKTVLVALSPENKVVFIDGAEWGVQKMDICNGAPQIMIMGSHRSYGVRTLTPKETTQIFRAWSCCTIEKEMNAIDASDLPDPVKAAFKDAVEKAWMGDASTPVICADPAMQKAMEQKQRQK